MRFSGLDLKNRDFGGRFCPISHVRTGAENDKNRAEENRENQKNPRKKCGNIEFLGIPKNVLRKSRKNNGNAAPNGSQNFGWCAAVSKLKPLRRRAPLGIG